MHNVRTPYARVTPIRIITRNEALRRWKRNQAPQATYKKLLELFVQAGCVECAEAVCEVLRKSCSDERFLSTSCDQSTEATHDQEAQCLEGTYLRMLVLDFKHCT